MPDPRELLDRLETRHEELVRKLDELNAQIELALAQFGKSRGEPTAEDREQDARTSKSASRRAA